MAAESERWQKLEELYHAALAREGGERQIFLENACEGDENLQGKIELMLSYHEESRAFLESPPFDASKLFAQLQVVDSRSETLVGKTVSHYRIIERIGAGGMGVVYKAEDVKLRRFVALKFLPSAALATDHDSPVCAEGPGHDSRGFERFQREARAASALDHPNICTVHEIDESDGRPFIVMQFLTGRTLKSEIAGKALPLDKVVDLGLQIADALDAAHGAGIVHRDIKPANIFVTLREEVKILDFGLAKLATVEPAAEAMLPDAASRHSKILPFDNSLTLQGETPGTVAYMSPEQVRGDELDGRTDIFSCGVALYEMATGRSPFRGETAPSFFKSILHDVPPAASELNPAVSDDLQRIISKAMARDRSARYQTAAALRDDLRSLKRASDTGFVAAGRRLASKRWQSAALLVLLVGAAGTYSHFYWRRPAQFAERGTVILADFANATGEPVFDGTLKQALRAQLEQSPFLNVVSDQKVSEQLRYMNRSPDLRLAPDMAREVCLRTGSEAVLKGSVSRLGDRYALGLEATNCHTGDSLGSEHVEAENREAVLRALGVAATKLRVQLGESLASVRKYDAPVEQVTTTSLEALQAYSLAVKTKSAEGAPASIPFFKRATELDPNFAMAYAGLGAAYATSNVFQLACAAVTRAYELRGRVSERERLYIESHYFGIVTGQYDRAIQAYELWQQAYPFDTAPYVNAGALYGSLGNHQKNAEEQRKALRLDSNLGSGYANLANAYLCLNQVDNARNALAQADARKIDNPLFWELRYELAFVAGDTREVERQVDTAMNQGQDRVLALQGDTEAYYGHLIKAQEFTRRAVELHRRNGDPESAFGDEVIGALREADFGNLRRARRQVETALAARPDQRSKALSALVLARAGADAGALSIVHDLQRQSPDDILLNQYWIPTVLATLQLRKNPSRAVEILDTTRPYELGVPPTPTNAVPYPIYIRGLAFLANGQGREAAEEFQRIIDHPGVVGNYPLGALARLNLARAYALEATRASGHESASEKFGDAAEVLANARRAYQDFFALWKDADPDIPILKQARAEFMKLNGVRR